MRPAIVLLFLTLLAAACGAPSDSRDPATDLACRLMPGVRQVRQDIHEAIAAAVRGDETATRRASERAGADGKEVADAVSATGLHGDALGGRLVQILSVGLWGEQVSSFFTDGTPDRAAITSFVATTQAFDSLVESVAADMKAAGLESC
jgi:hypothetical protein